MLLNRVSLPLMLALLCVSAQAQTVYRIVGPDGKVTFSDRPPETGVKSAQAVTPGTGSGAAPTAGLPYELGKTAARYPVTLYTGQNCAPCDTARRFLENRGIPFSERTVNTNEDLAALKGRGSDGALPFATIGSQHLSGFQGSEWGQYLDAAGYPKTSQLPANYRRPAATPLTQPAKAPEPAASTPTEPARRPTPRPAQEDNPVNPNNPAGLKF